MLANGLGLWCCLRSTPDADGESHVPASHCVDRELSTEGRWSRRGVSHASYGSVGRVAERPTLPTPEGPGWLLAIIFFLLLGAVPFPFLPVVCDLLSPFLGGMLANIINRLSVQVAL